MIKQRLAREGKGRSSGYRSLILFRRADRSIFVYGFAKNEIDNINPRQLKAFIELANEMLAYDNKALNAAMADQTIVEINCHE